ncbi:nitroreductase [Spirosoma sp. HMF4905]|uniref:Nitroreductase n=1 Tax=Spirosoma arboris TaxID=2682092 RepID=A0A7K1SJL5_9BACT|nr:nitroreductase [Spirosoma arboris]MVM33934.1 nitroreductase [Spirosoma arboris]
MNRRTFLSATGGLLFMKTTLSRPMNTNLFSISKKNPIVLQPNERDILTLAALAPSGHNTQPWQIEYIEPYHWIIGNDSSRWLPVVDPNQRETMLSLGAFSQSLDYAAGYYGYHCQWTLLATSNQDEEVLDVKLIKSGQVANFDITKLQERRTMRAPFLDKAISGQDMLALTASEKEHFVYIPRNDPHWRRLNEQTLDANRQQTYRNQAQQELANWIRFSETDAKSHRDGLTTAGLELTGISGWVVSHFFTPATVLKKSFREQGLKRVSEQVAHSGGWLLLTSPDSTPTALLEAGRRLQRLWVQLRERSIALHPMTQLLEEGPYCQQLPGELGISQPIQFLLRIGYVRDYPKPVSLRRSVDDFLTDHRS